MVGEDDSVLAGEGASVSQQEKMIVCWLEAGYLINVWMWDVLEPPNMCLGYMHFKQSKSVHAQAGTVHTPQNTFCQSSLGHMNAGCVLHSTVQPVSMKHEVSVIKSIVSFYQF